MDRLIEDILWQQVSDKIYIPREQYLKNFEGCTIEPVEIDGELAFVTVSREAEFHFISLGKGHPITGKMIWERLNAIIDHYGYVETKTPKDDLRQHRFNIRFGFAVTGEDEYDRHYRLERLRHA